ncbi:MAG: hypothetical protein GQ574_24465 [Crocinitomix sp.]|nr:hypothetical protein [Crocinitomix sp.]
MEKARSNGLTALCILSWVWMVIAIWNSFTELNTGRLTEADIRAQKIILIESQTPEAIEAAPWMIEDSVTMLNISSENFTAMVVINFVALIIGLIGVFMMFQLRKLGFHLYIIYSLISVGYWVYYFHGLTFGTILITISVVFSMLFVILYGTQLKKMS